MMNQKPIAKLMLIILSSFFILEADQKQPKKKLSKTELAEQKKAKASEKKAKAQEKKKKNKIKAQRQADAAKTFEKSEKLEFTGYDELKDKPLLANPDHYHTW